VIGVFVIVFLIVIEIVIVIPSSITSHDYETTAWDEEYEKPDYDAPRFQKIELFEAPKP